MKSKRKKIVLLVLGACLVAVLVQVAINSSIQTVRSEQIVVTGHRGAAYYAPENTIASVLKALELNVDRVEIDIQRTKDSVIVVCHDIDIDRTTNGKGKISDLYYPELMEAEILFEDSVYKVPTLEQVLQTVQGKSKLLIEIKEGNNFYPDIEKQILDLLEVYHAKDWCIIQSFSDDVLAKVRNHDMSIEIHKLFLGKLPFTNLIFSPGFSSLNKDLYKSVSEFSGMYSLMDKILIRDIHKKGKKINVWTVNDAKKMNRILDMGVDGIITDNPKLIW